MITSWFKDKKEIQENIVITEDKDKLWKQLKNKIN